MNKEHIKTLLSNIEMLIGELEGTKKAYVLKDLIRIQNYSIRGIQMQREVKYGKKTRI